MPVYYTQATLEADSALPEDRTVNTWDVSIPGLDPETELASWHDALFTFYDAFDNYLSVNLSGLLTLKSYARADTPPRVPVLSESTTITPAVGALPPEVALCMSFQGEKISGVNQARRRGRVYLGPFSYGANDTGTGKPIAGLLTAVQAAGAALLATSGTSTWSWGVWSTVNNSDTQVVDGWVDNAWDTQRRRGIRPTSRATF